MSVLQDTRMLTKVCELYYLQNMSQKEIAAQLYISRPQISRMIAQAREAGIVDIRIRNPESNLTSLEHALMKKYQLQDALVTHSGEGNASDRMRRFCEEAAPYLEHLLLEAKRVGVMSGGTIAALVGSLPQKKRTVEEVIPLAGGLGTVMSDAQANYCAGLLAGACAAKSYSLNAPFLLSSAQTARLMREEAAIAEVLHRGEQCDLALVGIGTIAPESTTVRISGMTAADLAVLRQEGAVASCCSSFLNAGGTEVATSITGRSLGQHLSGLGPARVAACAFGSAKVSAIDAALKSGKINLLMTNDLTAESLLAL